MKKLTQASFAEPADYAALVEEALVVHQTAGATNTRLIIFVHGLGGSRYGEHSTWGRLPELLFNDVADLDVGLYQYRTLFGRLRFWRSVPLDTEAAVLADIIRDELSNYRTIVLVGHSMGGLLCKAAIARLIDNNEKAALRRIAGLFLMATPQLGSLRVPRFLARFSPDFRALEPHGQFIADVNRTLENHVCFDERGSGFDRIVIPTWAVLGASDFWVDQISAGIGLSSNRKKIARGSHTEIVKPKDKESGIYVWLRDRVQISLRRYRYDVFLASAMAALDTEAQYQAYRADAMRLEQVLKQSCRFESVFYAGRNLKTKKEFEAQNIALKDDLDAIEQSRYFMLLFPEKKVSSVLFESGLALALGKPSVYFVRDRAHLPFLMARAEQAALAARVGIYEYADIGDITNLLEHHGEKLWISG